MMREKGAVVALPISVLCSRQVVMMREEGAVFTYLRRLQASLPVPVQARVGRISTQ